MSIFKSHRDIQDIEARSPHWHSAANPSTLYAFLQSARAKNGQGPALSFQLYGKADSPAQTLTWDVLVQEVTRLANLFRAHGIGPEDCVALVLPNCFEAVTTLLAGAVSGIVCPINPLLSPDHIASILRDSVAKLVITMRSFPNSQVAQNISLALAQCDGVKTVLEVDFAHYVTGPKALLIPMMRPKFRPCAGVTYLDLASEQAKMPGDALSFADDPQDRVGAYFHTGGTTGRPKLVQHRVFGILYQGWAGGNAFVQTQRCGHLPSAVFPCFRGLPRFNVHDSGGWAFGFTDPAGLSRFWGLGTVLEIDRTLAGHLCCGGADRSIGFDAEAHGRRFAQLARSFFWLGAAVTRSVSSF